MTSPNIHIYKSLQYGYSVNRPNSAGQRRHGLEMQSLGHINNCNNYGRNILFAASKVFERFCNQVPKVKYCHEFTSGDFSQSILEEVIILFLASQCGHLVRTLASRQGVLWSNSITTRNSCEVYPGLGILQPQWKLYPTLPTPSRTHSISGLKSRVMKLTFLA